MIPLLDLKEANRPMQAEIDAAVLRVSRSGWYILGPEVEAFEAEWAAYCGAKYCVATGNALDALRIILMAHGIGEDDEVIVPANTYIATWLAVTLAGATPVPVEPEFVSMNIDTNKVESAITPRTRAILAVHLYGRAADMQLLSRIADKHGLLLFDDAAQAHGASVGGRAVGSLCDATAFSFYPTKNLGALGDAGCITTGDEQLAKLARRLRNYGGVGRLDHTAIGINSRMDEMQAAILRVKLPWLDSMNARRKVRAEAYSEMLSFTPCLILPLGSAWSMWGTARSVWHQYVCRTPVRDALVRYAAAQGLELHVHYPVPPHLEGAYRHMSDMKLPIAEQMASEVFSLPIGYDVDQQLVADIVLSGIRSLK
jgi:dTDP-4-amino-4,6-dideoxygalactose transaminase